ncbi:hypothetical protein GCM10023231_06160 [Olivibacter ginsenosidimutans]|uniref:Glycosyltransferase 2-like domain-containing protein n=1 Tax=Olivibacter ginsenosidimutans TaxID=1176537 RepID=A0ABP9AHE0_9SPHI
MKTGASSKSSNPLVSILMATYNGSKFVCKQLDSIINQTYHPKEIIILDDCSTDDTFVQLKEKQRIYPDIMLYRNAQNIGYVRTFEKLMTLCNGDYVLFSDQDDVWMPNKISQLISQIGQHLLIYHNSFLIDEDDKLIAEMNTSDTIGALSTSSNKPLMYNNCVPGHAMMFDKELLGNVLPIPEGIPYDHWIAYAALTIGNVKYINERLAYHRKHPESYTYVQSTIGKNKEIRRFKLERLRKINSERISYLKALATFKENTVKDNTLINALIDGLKQKANKGFSFKLFFTLFMNRREIFSIYKKKSTVSYLIKIYKECRGLTLFRE